MPKQEITTSQAPAAIGPYAQAVLAGGLLFSSGQIPVNPTDGTVPVSVDEQAKQALINLGAILEQAGIGFADVLKTTVFIRHMEDFAAINAVYATFFKEPYPARSCVEVSALPKGVLLEIEAIAAC
ncbi:RidA family protein [Ethanoligenens sp.]|uniref:RidA family protein n=1 Tax=Ethanoligenens sp. TaxID=2099655 RepID=UPI0039E7FDC8